MQATVPQKTAVVGTPEMRSAGTPNPSVKITSSEGAPRKMSTYVTAAARAGKKTGFRPLRITARSSPTIRMIGSATMKILKLSLNPSSTLGKASLKSGQLKKAWRTDSHPDVRLIRKVNVPKKMIELTKAIAAERRTSARVQADLGASSSAISSSVSSPGMPAAWVIEGQTYGWRDRAIGRERTRRVTATGPGEI